MNVKTFEETPYYIQIVHPNVGRYILCNGVQKIWGTGWNTTNRISIYANSAQILSGNKNEFKWFYTNNETQLNYKDAVYYWCAIIYD